MAFRARKALASHLSRRLIPSCPHILPPDRDADHPKPSPRPQSIQSMAAFHGGRRIAGTPFPLGISAADLIRRSYSASAGESGASSFINDAAEVLSDGGLESAVASAPAPFPGEVAAAAADSFFPVAVLQHFIDGVHSFTGLNWWACIALTTVLIRGITVPILLNQMKAGLKLSMMKPELEKLKDELQNSTNARENMEVQLKMKALFKKHGVSPFSPFKGMFIQGPIFVSFFFAISNMVEKVPSFKGGGVLWFTDLTTPDSLYIFPVLTSLTFLATVELNMQEGMEGNNMGGIVKNFSRVMALLTIPFTASFPKAIFCYWVTSNLFSLTYGRVIKHPPVRKFLNLPEIVPQPANATQPNFSFFNAFNSKSPVASILPAKGLEVDKTSERKVSSSTVISQKIRNLEKTVKARKKTKKR